MARRDRGRRREEAEHLVQPEEDLVERAQSLLVEKQGPQRLVEPVAGILERSQQQWEDIGQEERLKVLDQGGSSDDRNRQARID